VQSADEMEAWLRKYRKPEEQNEGELPS
jgi:hypothetical protein